MASSAVGMPTVKSVMTEALRRSTGKKPMTRAETMSMPSDRMRVRKTRRMSCMPLRMRWPSPMAEARAEKPSSMRMRSATPRVAWLPLPMAMARLERFSESTSLTPSPVMAT